MYFGVQVKFPLFLPNYNKILKFLDRFLKKFQMSIFTEIRPVGPALFTCGRADGWTMPMGAFRAYVSVQ
jgi:hypothetical protein